MKPYGSRYRLANGSYPRKDYLIYQANLRSVLDCDRSGFTPNADSQTQNVKIMSGPYMISAAPGLSPAPPTPRPFLSPDSKLPSAHEIGLRSRWDGNHGGGCRGGSAEPKSTQ